MSKSFQEAIKSDKPVLVDFSAEWCGPCKMLGPILKEVKHELGDKVTILKIDVDRNPAISQQLHIQSVPTMILYKNGKSLWRQSGVLDKKNIISIINQHL
ncbi:MAG TPA: thioredoxin [Chitinophagales bacterium]|nr:thioredoxin [Chitinophagales bacterium]